MDVLQILIGDGAVALLGLLEDLSPTAYVLAQVVDNLVLPELEGTNVALEDFQSIGALLADLESLDATIEEEVHFRRALYVANIDAHKVRLLLRSRTLTMYFACILAVRSCWLPGMSSLVGRMHSWVFAEHLVHVLPNMLNMLWGASASR